VFAAIVLSLIGCNSTDSLDPNSSTQPETVDQGASVALSTTSFAGGIPIGIFALPTSEFGSRYNGAMRNIWPGELLGELAAIKGRGGKVGRMFAGSQE